MGAHLAGYSKKIKKTIDLHGREFDFPPGFEP